MMKRYVIIILAVLLSACGSGTSDDYPSDSVESPSPTIADVLLPVASGTATASDGTLVLVDYSNTTEGYIQVKTLSDDHQGLIVLVIKDDTQYRYDIDTDYTYVTLPLNMGDGTYKVKVCENIDGNRYAVLFTVTLDVQLSSDNIVYLYPNQIVDYDLDTEAVSISFTLTEQAKTQLERVYDIYNYVTDNIDYDYDKLDEARSSYILPVLDEIIDTKKGICFDYASLMSAMLRVQGIPTKVITGYVDDGYHAWVEVYIDGEGWINPQIYFESDEWKRIDPTYDAAGYDYEGTYDTVYEY